MAAASRRIVDLGGGTGYDMSRDLGIEMFVGFDQFVYSKGELELAARVLGLDPTNMPFVANTTGSVSDPDRAFQEADIARRCGLRHGSGLHPNVVEPQIRGLTPPPDEVEAAHSVLEAYRRLMSEGKTWEEVDGRTIDKYEARRARELLQWAEACAERDREKAEAVSRTEAAEERGEST
jgi:citrate lyase beta subunit